MTFFLKTGFGAREDVAALTAELCAMSDSVGIIKS